MWKLSITGILILFSFTVSSQTLKDLGGTGQISNDFMARNALLLPNDTVTTKAKNSDVDSCQQIAKVNGIVYSYNCVLHRWQLIAGDPIIPTLQSVTNAGNLTSNVIGLVDFLNFRDTSGLHIGRGLIISGNIVKSTFENLQIRSAGLIVGSSSTSQYTAVGNMSFTTAGNMSDQGNGYNMNMTGAASFSAATFNFTQPVDGINATTSTQFITRFQLDTTRASLLAGGTLQTVTNAGNVTTNKIGIQVANPPLAPIHVGNYNLMLSSDAQILISRRIDNTGTGNAHAFADNSVVSRTGTVGYASYDDFVKYRGSANQDHHVAYQSRFVISSTGLFNDVYGGFHQVKVDSGAHITRDNGWQALPPILTNGSLIDSVFGFSALLYPNVSKRYSFFSNGGAQLYNAGMMNTNGIIRTTGATNTSAQRTGIALELYEDTDSLTGYAQNKESTTAKYYPITFIGGNGVANRYSYMTIKGDTIKTTTSNGQKVVSYMYGSQFVRDSIKIGGNLLPGRAALDVNGNVRISDIPAGTTTNQVLVAGTDSIIRKVLLVVNSIVGLQDSLSRRWDSTQIKTYIGTVGTLDAVLGNNNQTGRDIRFTDSSKIRFDKFSDYAVMQYYSTGDANGSSNLLFTMGDNSAASSAPEGFIFRKDTSGLIAGPARYDSVVLINDAYVKINAKTNLNAPLLFADRLNNRLGALTATPTSTLSVNGSTAYATRTVTGATSLIESDHYLNVNNSAPVVISLPVASTCVGREYVITKTSNNGNTVTVTPASGLIGAAATQVLSSWMSYTTIWTDGTNWFIH